MAVFLLKLIFATISTLSNYISRILLHTIAHAIALGIKGLKIPGTSLHQGLEQVGELIKGCMEFVVGFVLELISSAISSFFLLLKQGLLGSGGDGDEDSGGDSTVVGLIKKTTESLTGVTNETIPELINSFTEMITTIISDFWSNSAEAIEIVKESALESSE